MIIVGSSLDQNTVNKTKHVRMSTGWCHWHWSSNVDIIMSITLNWLAIF